MKTVTHKDLRAWLQETGAITELSRGMSREGLSADYTEEALGVPRHVRLALERLRKQRGEPVGIEGLASIPFYSLCRGLLLPLELMAPEKAAHLFGIKVPAPPAAKEREALLERFFEAEIGLDPGQKLCCVLGDPFRGRPATLRRNSLVQVLESLVLASRRELLNRLTRAGNVAVLFAECRAERQSDPALTAAEVLEALAVVPELRRNAKLELLRDLLRRMGKLEAFFLAKLVLRKAGFGFDYQGSFVARVLGARFGVAAEQVSHAMALTDAFNVLEVLERDGPDGLRAIRLQPLVPVRPALASGSSTRELKHFPVWVERKYDGIRLLLHKSTDARGSVLCGAYTRSRGDWIEAIPGIEMTARQVP
ncbi:MAG: hypothetical protein ACYS22_16145, partial [Planctomycetota bacterium]